MKFIIKTIAIIFSISLGLWIGGLVNYYFLIPSQAKLDPRKTASIIALTGGKDRIAEAIRLFNEGYAERLLISGVGKDTKEIDLINNLDLSREEIEKIDFSQVGLGYEATNTIENALEAKDWSEVNKITSIRLVTANYHMPRALKLFKTTMPQMYIIPHPVFPKDFQKEEWYKNKNTIRLIVSEYNKYLLTF